MPHTHIHPSELDSTRKHIAAVINTAEMHHPTGTYRSPHTHQREWHTGPSPPGLPGGVTAPANPGKHGHGRCNGVKHRYHHQCDRFNKSPCWHHHATCCLYTTDPTNLPEGHQQYVNTGRVRPSWCEKWSGRGTASKSELSHQVGGLPPAHPSKRKVPPKTRPRQTYTHAHTPQTQPNARVPARGRHRWRAHGGGNARKYKLF